MIANLRSQIADRLKKALFSRDSLLYIIAALAWSSICLAIVFNLSKLTGGDWSGLRFPITFLASSVFVGIVFRKWIRESKGFLAILAAAAITFANGWLFFLLMAPGDSGYAGGPLMLIPASLGMLLVTSLFVPLGALAALVMGIISIFVMRQADQLSLRWGSHA